MSRGPAASCLALALLLAGCAPSGDDPLSRWSEWRPASGEYAIRYLEPPWEIADEGPSTLLLRIRSNAMVHGMLEAGPGKYELAATVEPGVPDARIAAERAAAARAGAEVLVEPREIVTAEGVSGREIVTYDPEAVWDRYRRIVLLPLDATRLIRLEIAATPELDTAEITAMIRLVAVGPAGP